MDCGSFRHDQSISFFFQVKGEGGGGCRVIDSLSLLSIILLWPLHYFALGSLMSNHCGKCLCSVFQLSVGCSPLHVGKLSRRHSIQCVVQTM